MAVLKDRKRDYYAMRQNLRDEAGAPEHLDTAGDAMIRGLAKKQTDTATSLEEQLHIHQEFEKGSQLEPWTQSGLTSLDNFQKSSTSEDPNPSTSETVDDVVGGMKARSGLSRHELELGLVEKPGSQTAALYRFAISNRKGKIEKDDLVSKLDRHPLNRLKEIEEEMFGKKQDEEEEEEKREMGESTKKKKRRKRKRVRKRKEVTAIGEVKPKEEEEEEDESSEENALTSHRPSLWDVKDMRKFCRDEQQGCEVKKLYTIRDGKIVQVDPPEGNC